MPGLKELTAAFKAFDADGNGRLSAEEMVSILTRPDTKTPLTLEEATALVKEFDCNGDGELDLEEVRAHVHLLHVYHAHLLALIIMFMLMRCAHCCARMVCDCSSAP